MYISASAPDAPPFSDTTIGCFIRLFFWMAACIILAIWSEAPPAPAATTISTGLLGSHAATTVELAARNASVLATTNSLLMSLLLFISVELAALCGSAGRRLRAICKVLDRRVHALLLD